MKIEEARLKTIVGGINITGTLLTSFGKVIEIILEIGRSLGSSIRRIDDRNICPY